MTKKQLRLMVIMLPMLALGAFAVNSDAIFAMFGSKKTPPAQPNPNNVAGGTPIVTHASSAPKVPVAAAAAPVDPGATTISISALSEIKIEEASLRDPFMTLAEQNPQLSDAKSQQEIWPPPDKSAQIIFISKVSQRIACIDGQRLHVGDAYFGGKIVSIEKDRVIAEKDGRQCVIPLASVSTWKKKDQGKDHEKAEAEKTAEPEKK